MKAKQPQIRWSEDRVQFLRDHYPNVTAKALTKAFNAEFGLEVSEAAIGFQLHRFRILKAPAQPPARSLP